MKKYITSLHWVGFLVVLITTALIILLNDNTQTFDQKLSIYIMVGCPIALMFLFIARRSPLSNRVDISIKQKDQEN